MNFKYIIFQSSVGNKYTIQLNHIVEVLLFDQNRRIKIQTDAMLGNELIALEDSPLICTKVMDEYINWLNIINERSSMQCFNFTECRNKVIAQLHIQNIQDDLADVDTRDCPPSMET